MKKWLLLVPLLCACAEANAADLKAAVTPTTAAPVYVDPWTGFYAGIHGGYANGVADQAFFFNAPLNIGTEPGARAQGITGGLHAGYGLRCFGNIYCGVEIDGDLANALGSAGVGPIQVSNNMNWMMSARARLGYIINNVLIFGSAGYGLGGFNQEFTNFANLNVGGATTLGGFVWSAGIEANVVGNWFARAEFMQYQFPNASIGSGNFLYAVNENINVIRGGISYKF